MFYQYHHIGSAEYFKKETGENFTYPLHLHRCFELLIVLDGVMTVSVDHVDYRVEKNQATLIFPDQMHAMQSEQSRHLLFIFSPKLVTAFYTKYLSMLPVSNLFAFPEELLSRSGDLDEASSVIAVKGFLYSACARFEALSRFRAAGEKEKDLLSRIFRFVEENFARDCSLQTLAKTIGYDPAYLSRYFKRATGIPYNRYADGCRLNNAGYLLRNTDLSILECSIESGYSSLRSFNRNFKSSYGITPAAFRRANSGK